MRIEDGLVLFLALATGGVLLAGLAQALDGRRNLPRSGRGPVRAAGDRRPFDDRAVGVAAPAAPPAMAEPPPGEFATAELSNVPAGEPPAGEPPGAGHAAAGRAAEPTAAEPAPAEPAAAEGAAAGSAAAELLPAATAEPPSIESGVDDDAPRWLTAALAPPFLDTEAGSTEAAAAIDPSGRIAWVESLPVIDVDAGTLPARASGASAATLPQDTSAAPSRAPLEGTMQPELFASAAAAAIQPGEAPAAGSAATAPGVIDEAAAPAAPAAEPAAAGLPACLRAYEAGDYAACEPAAAALARTRTSAKRGRRGDGATAPLEQVAAWSVLALSRRALGQEGRAAAAFESGARWAAAVAAGPVPPTCDGLAPRLGRHLLSVGEAAPGSAEQRAVLRLAATWLAATAASAPGDGDVAALTARAGDAFVAAVHLEVEDRVGRRDFTGAHAAMVDAVAGSAVPEARRAEVRDLLWTSVTGEIGRLVGRALHADGDRGASSGHPGGEAPDVTAAGTATGPVGVAALAAAAEVIAAVQPGAFTPERHQDLARRLWWAHMQLGGACRARGDLEGALAPLAAAVELAGADADREAEAREAVARVIEALVERLGADSRSRLRAGDLDGAMAASRRLSEIVDAALSRGLSPSDLSGALARRQEVMLELAEDRPV